MRPSVELETLRGCVAEAVWSVEGRSAGAHRVVPDGRAQLIAKAGTCDRLYVVGPMAEAVLVDMTPATRTVGVRLLPWEAARLVGLPASELRGVCVELRDVWGDVADDHLERVLGAADVAGARARLAATVPSERAQTAPSFVLAAVATIDRDPSVRVGDLADHLGVGTRRLRRAFLRWVGLSPKTYARVRRVRRAMELRRADGDWVRVALDAGFADQPHLAREFRRVAGVTPRAWECVRNRQDATSTAT